MKVSVFATAVGCCGVLAVAGCGGGNDNNNQASTPASTPAPAQKQTTTTAAGGGGAKAATISETEFKLTPSTANVGSGAVTVTAKNDGSIPHTLEVEGNGVEKKTGMIQAGSSAALKLNLKPGTYEMYCTIPGHKQSGMLGKVVVK
jgi:plastocyanin